MHSKSNSSKQKLRRKHIPQRSCIACRETKDKRALIRLVYNAGNVEIDTGGKRPGRGAYLCSTNECWEIALRRNHLEHALRTKLTLENYRTLIEYGKSLAKKEEFVHE